MFLRPASATIALLLVLSVGPARADNRSDSVQVEPERIRIGIFYSGREVRVSVSAPACEGVVMRMTGAEEPLVLNRTGKKYGFLWMNVGKVHYEAVPAAYLLCSSRKLDELATPETLDRLKLGFDALGNQVPAGSEDGARELFPELVKLKQKDRLFTSEAAGVQLGPVEAGRQEASGEFFLPAKAPLGDYAVDVFAFREHAGELIGTATVHLERSAAVSSIASLAAHHGLMYGCLAVAAAIMAGLLTGFVFRG